MIIPSFPIQTTCYICVASFLVAPTIHVVVIVASLFTIHSFPHLKMQVGSVRPMKDAWVKFWFYTFVCWDCLSMGSVTCFNPILGIFWNKCRLLSKLVFFLKTKLFFPSLEALGKWCCVVSMVIISSLKPSNSVYIRSGVLDTWYMLCIIIALVVDLIVNCHLGGTLFLGIKEKAHA